MPPRRLTIDLVDANEAAAILGVTPRSIRRYGEVGRLRPILPALGALYLRADVELLRADRAAAVVPSAARKSRETTVAA